MTPAQTPPPAIYRKESDEFDRDYAKKYDGNLNTSLTFVSDWV